MNLRSIFVVLFAVASAPAAGQEAPLNPLVAPARDALSAALARPLFSASRRPPPEPVVATIEEARAQAPNLNLVGIMQMDGKPVVYASDPASQRSMSFRLGDVIGGWTVSDISRDRIVLEQADETAEILLFDPRKQPTPPTKGQGLPQRAGAVDFGSATSDELLEILRGTLGAAQ